MQTPPHSKWTFDPNHSIHAILPSQQHQHQHPTPIPLPVSEITKGIASYTQLYTQPKQPAAKLSQGYCAFAPFTLTATFSALRSSSAAIADLSYRCFTDPPLHTVPNSRSQTVKNG
jgi:hypothetical protein